LAVDQTAVPIVVFYSFPFATVAFNTPRISLYTLASKVDQPPSRRRLSSNVDILVRSLEG
jgi:hypothetical protein